MKNLTQRKKKQRKKNMKSLACLVVFLPPGDRSKEHSASTGRDMDDLRLCVCACLYV